MEAQQIKLDVTAHNIANVSTPGFKKSRAEFQDLIYQNMRSPGAATGEGTQSPTGMQVGLGVRSAGTQRIQSQGSLQQTGNPLDLAIEGRGFFGVTLPNGEEAYTRDGALKLDPEGLLVTTDGFRLASSITVPPDAQTVSIAADGTVTATIQGQTAPVGLGQIELVTFANPAGLVAMGRNLFQETQASGAPVTGVPGTNGLGTVSQGALELSNVNVVEEMIDLITGQRAYEVNARVIRAGDEMLQQTANLK
jgi:flagellar basal-body rod protein FlgG